MTVNTLTIELTCNGKTLKMGPGQDIDITAVSGLESSEVEISTSDNALVDGASVDGKKIKPRPIHIEASFRSSKNNPENRAKVIKFFNPKYTGKALITNMGVSRNIEYELEGWTFAASKNMDSKLKILVDLICPARTWRTSRRCSLSPGSPSARGWRRASWTTSRKPVAFSWVATLPATER